MLLKRDRFVVRIDGSRLAAELFAPYLVGLRSERLCVAHLDDDLRLLHLSICPAGSEQQVGVPLRLIMSEALRVEARGLLLGHNHPSGDPTPSDADRRVTRSLAEAAAALGIRLIDHLVFADAEVASFRALGLL